MPAQQIRGLAQTLLKAAGYALTDVPDGHLCCGSAGTYSILHPEIAKQLLANKVGNLESGKPEVIGTANIGCLAHIQSGTQLPVRHWVELIDEAMTAFAGGQAPALPALRPTRQQGAVDLSGWSAPPGAR